jgi:hypothetical protein
MAPRQYHIAAATDETVFFFPSEKLSIRTEPVRFSLEQISACTTDLARLAGQGKKGASAILVVPDLWLKQDFFSFQPQKKSLVNAFLERKLRTAYPHLPHIDRFFTFKLKGTSAEERGVNVFFLQEQNAFLLHEALVKAKISPRWITTPALLWADRLRKIIPDFTRQATLLTDLRREQTLLYFFYKGEFLFSRRLALPDEHDRWETLLFEINQSIYLFAQKTKSALGGIYLAGDTADFQKYAVEKLDLPIQTLKAQVTETALPPDLSCLAGVWSQAGVEAPSDFNSITDKTIRRELRWKPVQWCGILTAMVSILAFSCVNLWLDDLQQEKLQTRSLLMEKQSHSLSEIELALDALTRQAGRTPAAHTLMQIDAARPESMRIDELKIHHEQLNLYLSATINADHIDRVRHSMKLFAENLNRQLDLKRRVGIQDMVVQVDDLKQSAEKTTYRISLKATIP